MRKANNTQLVNLATKNGVKLAFRAKKDVLEGFTFAEAWIEKTVREALKRTGKFEFKVRTPEQKRAIIAAYAPVYKALGDRKKAFLVVGIKEVK